MLVYDMKDKHSMEKALFAFFPFCRISDFYKEQISCLLYRAYWYCILNNLFYLVLIKYLNACKCTTSEKKRSLTAHVKCHIHVNKEIKCKLQKASPHSYDLNYDYPRMTQVKNRYFLPGKPCDFSTHGGTCFYKFSATRL